MANHYAYEHGIGGMENGYHAPTKGGITNVGVCDTIMYNEGVLSPYSWSCGTENVVSTYGGIVGYSAIGGGENWGVSMYQDVDWAEYGPCPAHGNPEC